MEGEDRRTCGERRLEDRGGCQKPKGKVASRSWDLSSADSQPEIGPSVQQP